MFSLRFTIPRKYGEEGRVNIFAHHGHGSGMAPAASVNKMATFANSVEADVYLIGHYTRLAKAHINRMYPLWTKHGAKLLHKDKLVIGTGAFTKSYQEGSMYGRVNRGGYAEQQMMPPATIGAPIIRIRPKERDKIIEGVRYQWFEPEITEES